MNKPLNMQLVGDAQSQPFRERRNNSRRDGQPQGGRRFNNGDQPQRRGNNDRGGERGGERGNFRSRNNEGTPRRRSSSHNQ